MAELSDSVSPFSSPDDAFHTPSSSPSPSPSPSPPPPPPPLPLPLSLPQGEGREKEEKEAETTGKEGGDYKQEADCNHRSNRHSSSNSSSNGSPPLFKSASKIPKPLGNAAEIGSKADLPLLSSPPSLLSSPSLSSPSISPESLSSPPSLSPPEAGKRDPTPPGLEDEKEKQEEQEKKEEVIPLPSRLVIPSLVRPRPTLTRTSSLNAKAREFVPKATSAISSPSPLSSMQHSPRMISSPTGPPPPSSIFPSPLAGPHHGHMLRHPQLLSPGQPYMMQHSPVGSPTFGDRMHFMDMYPPQLHNLNSPRYHEMDHLDNSSYPTSPTQPFLSEEAMVAIINQVEFYFGDSNLATDSYLMKFIRKDPEGYVPIAVVASFRKMKNLVKHHGLVATALRQSSQLVVSDDGKRVRRRYPLQDVHIDEIQSQTVVAENLPEDHSIQAMEKLFRTVGNVKMIRICQPDAVDAVNQYPKTDILVSNKVHALVEYESAEQAEKAVSELSDERNWRSGLRVRLLSKCMSHGRHAHQQPLSGFKGRNGEDDASAPLDGYADEVSQSAENADEMALGGGMYLNGRGRGRGRARGGLRGVVVGGSRGLHLTNGGRNVPVGISSPSHGGTNMGVEVKPPPGPRMPDGTRGFAIGRGKPITSM